MQTSPSVKVTCLRQPPLTSNVGQSGFWIVRVWVVCRHYQAVGIGFLFWASWFVAGGCGFGLVSVGCFWAGGVGVFSVVRQCGAAGFSGSGQASSSCPTSQSKGLPAVPAGEVGFFHR